MKRKHIYILVSAGAIGAIAIGAIIAFTIFATTNSNFRRTTLGRIVRWVFLDGGTVAQRANDLAEDIEKKIGAEKLQAWCEETMTRYKANELLTDGNSPYWSAGDIKLADEEIPEFIKNVWPKQPDAILPEPDVSIYIANDGEPKYIAISWYYCGVMVGPLDYVERYSYFYLRQVKPGVYVYGKDK
ncbi:MAG: hypothetical protein OEW48_05385 [Phycisphaerae bacterium]|nr:hypothetical protein [Phycisphaerae bacterium]